MKKWRRAWRREIRIRQALPFQARDERTGHGVQVLQHVRKGLHRRFFHRQHLDVDVVDTQMVAMALQGRVAEIEVQMRVVLQGDGIGLVRRVIHEPSQHAKRLAFRE